MEIPGDFFRPHIGLVNQTTYAPIGRLSPWKVNRITLEPEVNQVDTNNNAVPHFDTSIWAKRKATGTFHQACFDPLWNIYGVNPYGLLPLGAALNLHEGLVIRSLCAPDISAAGVITGLRAVAPLLGNAATELPEAIPELSYIFLAMRITKIHHEADMGNGQPFDFDFVTVWPYSIPGESTNLLTTYGFSATVGTGGFL